MAFELRLRELGFTEGRNLVIEYRSAEGRLERLADLAADLARQNCDVLIAGGPEATLAAIKQATRDTPINLKTLKALGLTIPQSIRARADRVIE